MNTIDCESARRRMSHLWDGESSPPEERASLQAHLDGCGDCRRLDQEMRAVLSGAALLREERYHRPMVVAPLVIGRRPTFRPLAPWLLGGAVIAALLVFSAVLVSRRFAPQSGGEVVVHLSVPLPGAASVAIVGDFTGWRDAVPLQRGADGVWVGEVRVKAGRYRYMLVVDGRQLLTDPASPQVVDDGFGGKSSVIDVDGSI